MRKIRMVLLLAAIFSAQSVFAHDSKSCKIIADACSKAGFTRTEKHGKDFWKNCMKPVVLGQTVKGVTVDADAVKTCRNDKIEELKKELAELEKVS